jgi:hypothetical protein
MATTSKAFISCRWYNAEERAIHGCFTLALIFLLVLSCAVAFPAWSEVYRLLTRWKRKAATRERLARLPPPEEALKDADQDKLVAYLYELLGDGEVGDALRDEEIKARFDEVARIVERRRKRPA